MSARLCNIVSCHVAMEFKLNCYIYLVCCIAVYDSGTVFDLAILDITDDDIRARFLEVSLDQLSCNHN